MPAATPRAAPRFTLTAPVVREPVLHKQIADVFRKELAPPGRLSNEGVLWWSVDMAAYAGTVPGIRSGRGCIAGIPDMFVSYLGLSHFIEVKADDGSLSPSQAIVATEILRGGGLWGVARSAIEALALLDRWNIPRAHRIRGL